jgi:hypothetical protein
MIEPPRVLRGSFVFLLTQSIAKFVGRVSAMLGAYCVALR